MNDKIKEHHLARKAILYIRQSSLHQVHHNQESLRLQYAMADRLRDLGWTDIDVIDDDLGQSAPGTVSRTGFDRMVAAVCMGHVGAVAAREVSRFARNSKEWQQLVEVCRVVDTLLIDQDSIYCPRVTEHATSPTFVDALRSQGVTLVADRSASAGRAQNFPEAGLPSRWPCPAPPRPTAASAGRSPSPGLSAAWPGWLAGRRTPSASGNTSDRSRRPAWLPRRPSGPGKAQPPLADDLLHRVFLASGHTIALLRLRPVGANRRSSDGLV